MQNKNTTYYKSQYISDLTPPPQLTQVRSLKQQESSIANFVKFGPKAQVGQDRQSHQIKHDTSPVFSICGDSPLRNFKKPFNDKENYIAEPTALPKLQKVNSDTDDDALVMVNSYEEDDGSENSSPLDEGFMAGDSQLYFENSQILGSSFLGNMSETLPSLQISSILGTENAEPFDLTFSTFLKF